MQKVGKITRPFRYDLNQISYYSHKVEERSRFKELDLIDRVPDELWTEVHDIVQETWIKTIPKKNVASEMTQRQDTHTRNRQRHNSGRRKRTAQTSCGLFL